MDETVAGQLNALIPVRWSKENLQSALLVGVTPDIEVTKMLIVPSIATIAIGGLFFHSFGILWLSPCCISVSYVYFRGLVVALA